MFSKESSKSWTRSGDLSPLFPHVKSVRGLVRKISKSFKRRGLFGTLTHSMAHVAYVVRHRKSATAANNGISDFDLTHGVDTDGWIELDELDAAGESYLYAQAYVATAANAFREMLNGVPIKHEDFTFIDMGSGKGRTLLLASEWPFKKVIGVEFAKQLHDIARENIRRYRSDSQQCGEIESVCADAGVFPIPEGNLLIYFYNPFEEQIMRKVLANLARSLENHPRQIVIIYNKPILDALFEPAGFVRVVRDENYCVYRNNSR